MKYKNMLVFATISFVLGTGLLLINEETWEIMKEKEEGDFKNKRVPVAIHSTFHELGFGLFFLSGVFILSGTYLYTKKSGEQ